MTNTNHFDVLLFAAKQLAHCFCLCLYRTCRSFLHKNITILSMLESKQHQIDCLFQRHNESCHLRFRQCNRITLADLINPERNNRTTATHHITITRAANLRIPTQSTLRHSYLLLNSLGDTHRIDRISSLVCR